jgi:hypothetical protein
MLSTRRSLGVVLAIAAAGRAPAQAIRHLTLVQDLRIGAQGLSGQRDVLVAIAPDGRLIVAPRYGGQPIVAFDSLGNRLSWKVATGGRDDAEILFPTRVGFIAGTSTVWVADQGYGQIALIDSTGKVFKSIENPSWIHPSWAERRKYPVFASMQALALYKDTTMLMLPGRERALLDTPGYDRSGLHLLRAAWGGSIQRTLAMVPNLEDHVTFLGKNCQHTTSIPFGARTSWAVSVDGSRVVVVTSGTSVADSGTVRVTSIGERGDTVFSRVLPQPAVRVPQETIDNLLSSQRACGTFTLEAVRDSVSRRISAFRSFIIGVTPGRDQTTWLTMRPVADTATERIAIGLDERGEIIGSVTLPPNQPLVGADRTHVWTVESGRMRIATAIVRYRVEATPAQPPRSGRAASPPSTSRPPE